MKFDDFKADLDLVDVGTRDSDTSGMNGWAVPWSDLMMVMFVLFVVLFIYSQSKENIEVIFANNPKTHVSVSPAEDLVDMISFHREAMSPRAGVAMTPQDVLYRSGDGAVSMKEEDGELKIVMRGDAFFAPGNINFENKTRKYLAEVAEVLKTSTHAIHIIGHADESDVSAVGSKSAFELSARRAARVAQYFINDKSIDPARIIVSGRGGASPELPGKMGEVAGNNRRVEILVINTDISAR